MLCRFQSVLKVAAAISASMWHKHIKIKIKLTHVGFRAHGKIASRIVICTRLMPCIVCIRILRSQNYDKFLLAFSLNTLRKTSELQA